MEQTVTQTKKKIRSTPSVIERTVFLQVSLGSPGSKVKVDAGRIETDADKKLLRLSKEIYDSPALEQVRSLDNAIRNWVRSISVPSPVLRGRGVYLINIDAVETADSKLQGFMAERREAKEEFLDDYDDAGLKEKAKARLGTLYDEADYPTREKLDASFAFDYVFFAFETPAKLEGVSVALFARERERMEERWREATDEIVLLLRAEMKGLVDHMVDRLQPGEDGKKKIFHKSVLPNLSEFLENFALRNVTDDAALSALVQKAKDTLAGVNTEDLKKSDFVRKMVADAFQEIKSGLDGLVVEAPSRRILLDD